MEIVLLNIGFSLLAAILFMTTIFVIAASRNRFDLIDVAWGLTFISIAFVVYSGQRQIEMMSAQTLAVALVVIWGMRLSVHIYSRWRRSEREDARYAKLRITYAKRPGGLNANMYFRVYLVQAVLAVVVSLPVIVLSSVAPQAIGWLAIVGLVIWLIGFYFEVVGDAQLARFMRQSKGKNKLITTGLWSYTRHPNYFGEAVQWWGIFIIAVATPYWWLALAGPIVITLLLLYVTGVPMMEKHLADRPGWGLYIKRTSKFLPLPPKKR